MIRTKKILFLSIVLIGIIVITISSVTTGVLFFLTSSPYLLIPFTAFGLGIYSLTPRLALDYRANARNIGIALNFAALGEL